MGISVSGITHYPLTIGADWAHTMHQEISVIDHCHISYLRIVLSRDAIKALHFQGTTFLFSHGGLIT
jgi:hypothetical protein